MNLLLHCDDIEFLDKVDDTQQSKNKIPREKDHLDIVTEEEQSSSDEEAIEFSPILLENLLRDPERPVDPPSSQPTEQQDVTLENQISDIASTMNMSVVDPIAPTPETETIQPD